MKELRIKEQRLTMSNIKLEGGEQANIFYPQELVRQKMCASMAILSKNADRLQENGSKGLEKKFRGAERRVECVLCSNGSSAGPDPPT